MGISKRFSATIAVLVLVGVGVIGCSSDDNSAQSGGTATTPTTTPSASSVNHEPTLTLSTSSSMPAGSCMFYTVTDIAVTATDPDGDALTYTWTLLADPNGKVDGSLSAGDTSGRWDTCSSSGSDTVQVTVTDSKGASATASVQVP